MNRKKEKLKHTSNKGITLIALVITIIVMLILVAVTISMAVNGGLFEYAGNAGKETNNAVREEQQLASGKVTIDNKVYNSIDEYLNTGKPGITASVVKANPTTYFGKTVNYDVAYTDASSYGNGEWEIFYSDGDHIYIITKGHLAEAKLIRTGYNGTSEFTASNLQTKYPAVAAGLFDKTYDPNSVGSELKYSSEKSNMKATQYLLDSEVTLWSLLADNNYAEWAIGGPTFELFVNSYNAYYPDYAVTLETPSGYDYGYANPLLSSSSVPQDTYLNHSESTDYWLACPADATSTADVISVFGTFSSVGATDYRNEFAFRPVVCLKSAVSLEWNEVTSQYDLMI